MTPEQLEKGIQITSRLGGLNACLRMDLLEGKSDNGLTSRAVAEVSPELRTHIRDLVVRDIKTQIADLETRLADL